MSILIDSFLLFFLFIILGIAADLAVRNIKKIALTLKIRLFALGILLGIITTLPELSVGIEATVEGTPSLSVGNLLGGIIVLIGLIMGASLIFNRKINTSKNSKTLIPTAFIILSPILLGLDGQYEIWDGLMMVFLYIGLLFYLYRVNHPFNNNKHLVLIDKRKIIKAFCLSVTGVIFVILASNWIVKITVDLLKNTNISGLAIGLLIFSIGTNLPDISITLTSWRRKTPELSLSHLISSATANILVMGFLAVMRPINFVLGPTYYSLAFFLAVILSLFVYFCYSHKNLNRKEGFFLLGVYILFLLTNIFLIGL